MDIKERLTKIVSKALEGSGYKLYKLSYGQTAKNGNLEVIVDRKEPISLDDIVNVSGLISTALDKEDPIEVPYNLDVSSLGAEKPLDLEELKSYEGEYVSLHLSRPYKGENILEGTLKSVNEEVTLILNDKGRKVLASFPKKDIDKANLAIKF